MLPDLAVYCQSVSLNKGSYLNPTPILNNLHLTIPKGCIYGLIGPSGCGKTTLQKCIMGLYYPDRGRVSVFGLSPGSPGSSVPGPSVGYMPQDIALDNELTVREQLTFLGRINNLTGKVIDSRINEITSTLEIEDLDKRSGQFSGGQQRRISLACTLIHQPSLYLLDEPTVGSDIVLVHKIWNYLKHLRDTTGATIVISTHYIEEVNSADLFGFMSKGTIVIQDSPSNFKMVARTRTLEEAILKEYVRLFALPVCERKKSILRNQYPYEEDSCTSDLSNAIDLEQKSSIVGSSVDNVSVTLKASCQWAIFLLLIWRYVIRWKFTVNIASIITISLDFCCAIALFSVYGVPLKELSIGIVNHANHSIHLNNVTNYLTSNDLRVTLMPDENVARRATENGSTSAFIVVPSNWDSYLDQRVSRLFSDSQDSARLSQVELFQDTTHSVRVLSIQTQMFKAIESLIENVTIAAGHNPHASEFFDFQAVYESLDRPNILAPKFNFLVRLYVFFVESMAMGVFTAWFRLEGNEPVTERLISLGVRPYQLLASLLTVGTVFITTLFVLTFGAFTWIVNLPSPSSWFAVILLTTSTTICGICKARLVGTYVKSASGCLSITLFYTTILWLFGCIAWPYEGLPYFMQPLALITPQFGPSTSLIRMTVYGESIWTPQAYRGIGFACFWASVHLVITFRLARER